MKLIIFFESMTGSKVKDCITNDQITFIIEENDMGKAIGKNGANIKRCENNLKKRIKLIEFSSDMLQFVKNIIYPINADVKQEEGIIKIYGKDIATKAMLIGRERKNINHINDLVKRYFDIKEVRVF